MSTDRSNLSIPLWLLFAERAGESGATWVRSFQKYADVVRVGNRGVKFMRLGQVEDGYELLQKARDIMDSHKSIPDSMHAVLNRYYYGILAYYSYCIEDYELAAQQLTMAGNAIEEAVSEDSCLLLLAFDCQEFCFHHARITHKQCRWNERQEWINLARAMALNEEPLCKTHSGQSIYFSTFDGFLASLGPFNAEEQDYALDFTDVGRRINFINNFEQRLTGSLGQAKSHYLQVHS
jgi:hypothetical protein